MSIPILVTGGLGFIGGVVARSLLDLGHDLRILDDGRNSIAQGSVPKEIVIRAPIQSEKVAALLETWQPEVVLHFAASAFVGYGQAHPFEYVENNVSAFSVFLSTLGRYLRKVTLIHSGSCAVYGAAKMIPITEDHRTEPISWYGRTKLMAEDLAMECGRLYGFKVIAFRYFNAVGSAFGIIERRDYEERILPKLFRAVENDVPFVINGNKHPTPDGTCIRDYVHVLDLADAHIRAAIDPDIPRGIINLGSGVGYSVLDIIKTVHGITKKVVKIEYGPSRPGDPPVAIASNKKAGIELKWHPSRSIETAAQDAWNAWNDH